MRTKRIIPNEKYEYMYYDGKCLIFHGTKRLTALSIPDVDACDIDIRMREIIILNYGIIPENLTKSDKQFVKTYKKYKKRNNAENVES